MPPRLELVQSAQSFLQDPTVARAPLTKKIGFLESKGLTNEEIEIAMGGGGGGGSGQRQVGGQIGYASAPPVPQRDWRDLFIMAVVTGTVGLTAISIVKTYLLPLIRPSTLHGLQGDKEELSRQFAAAEERLERIEQRGKETKDEVDQGLVKVNGLVEEVSKLVKDIKTGEDQRDEEMKHLQDEVEEIRSLIPKMLDKTRSSQESSLADLQTELKSLKSLLINRRGPGMTSGTPSTSQTTSSPSFISGRPQIPAWQLAAAANANANATNANASPKSELETPSTATATTSPETKQATVSTIAAAQDDGKTGASEERPIANVT